MARSRKHKKRRKSPGSAPGSLFYVGEEKTSEVSLRVIQYDADHLADQTVPDGRTAAAMVRPGIVTWIQVDGIHDSAVIGELGAALKIHPLVIEDVLNTDHRPKVDVNADCIFCILKEINWDARAGHTLIEHCCLILGQDYVITFQERLPDVFEPVKTRIRQGGVRLRTSGPDYLFYALADAVIDQYFVVLEKISDLSESMEELVIRGDSGETLQTVQGLKQDLVGLRRVAWPVRDAVNKLLRDEHPFIRKETRLYLGDIADHSVQVLESVEALRDGASNLLEIYLSAASNRMNEVMKVLTIIATIFIPLTFVAGIYGMNFDYMPELHSVWGYPLVWTVMLVVAVAMLSYFRRKGWL